MRAVFGVVVLVAACHAAEYLKNIDYLGRGYDLVRGYPQSNQQVDPGFRQPVVALTYDEQRVTADKRFFLPDGATANQELSCSYAATVDEVHGAQSLYESLAADVSVSGEGWGFAFSASAQYKSVSEQTSGYHNVYVSSLAKCRIYSADLLDGITPTLAEGWRNVIGGLPLTSSPQETSSPYWKVIEAFGTHFAQAVSFGSRAVLRSAFEQVSWAKMQETNLNINVAASASYAGFTGSASGQTEQEKKAREEFESSRSTVEQFFLGALPSTDGKWETWAQEADKEPMPLAYTLESISELLTEKHFPDDEDIDAKRAVLKQHLEAYCDAVDGCGIPLDPPSVGFERLQTTIHKKGTIYCPAGKVVVSCGMKHEKMHSGTTWSAYPTDPFGNPPLYGCHCEGEVLTCHVTCVNPSVAGYPEHTSLSSQSTATCLPGTKVTGCGIEQTKLSLSTDVYPNGKNGCSCYNWFEPKPRCVVTCSPNVGNHVVRSNYGEGTVDVSCPAGTFVLGCGQQHMVAQFSNYEPMPAFYPHDLQTCRCHNRYGVTCHAICGVFTEGGLDLPLRNGTNSTGLHGAGSGAARRLRVLHV